MDPETLRDYCLAKPGTTEDFPFDEDTLTFKVMGKMFALISLERQPMAVNLKCDPERALDLRDAYHSVQPGYHMNKRHWNTIALEGDLPTARLKELIDHSYELVVSKLRRAERDQLTQMQR